MGRGVPGHLQSGGHPPLPPPDHLAIVEPVDPDHDPLELGRQMIEPDRPRDSPSSCA